MRIRGANGVKPQFKSKGLGTGGGEMLKVQYRFLHGLSTDVRGQEKMDIPAQAKSTNSPFLHLFILLKPSKMG